MTGSHWDAAYRQGDATRSWYQAEPRPSLRALDEAGATPADSVIDIGGGASRLVDALLDRGHTDITVLDISSIGVGTARQRLGEAARSVSWIIADLLSWTPSRTWAIWHDRATLHFFTDPVERARYVDLLNAATEVGSIAVLATFAPDGPDHCSGLPVTRHDAADLAELLGGGWQQLAADRQQHTTPAGVVQPFTWTTFRRK